MFSFFQEKFIELEQQYKNGKQIYVNGFNFNLKLEKKVPDPTKIIDYDWIIILHDNNTLRIPMGNQFLNCNGNRLDVIKQKLVDLGYETDNRLAVNLNKTIEDIYIKYK